MSLFEEARGKVICWDWSYLYVKVGARIEKLRVGDDDWRVIRSPSLGGTNCCFIGQTALETYGDLDGAAIPGSAIQLL